MEIFQTILQLQPGSGPDSPLLYNHSPHLASLEAGSTSKALLHFICKGKMLCKKYQLKFYLVETLPQKQCSSLRKEMHRVKKCGSFLQAVLNSVPDTEMESRKQPALMECLACARCWACDLQTLGCTGLQAVPPYLHRER